MTDSYKTFRFVFIEAINIDSYIREIVLYLLGGQYEAESFSIFSHTMERILSLSVTQL